MLSASEQYPLTNGGVCGILEIVRLLKAFKEKRNVNR
jgi:hypothetical protein